MVAKGGDDYGRKGNRLFYRPAAKGAGADPKGACGKAGGDRQGNFPVGNGKGLPDTSLLKPLAEIFGVSVGELLSGKRMDDSQIKSQADHIILESLGYEERQEKWKGILRYVFLGILVALGGMFFSMVVARFATSKDAAVSLGIGMYLCIVTITCTGIVLLRIKDKL